MNHVEEIFGHPQQILIGGSIALRGLNRKIVFLSPGRVSIVEEELPPLKPEEIRVKTCRTLISTGTEIAHLSGKEWRLPDGRVMPQYPTYPGYSNAGVVVETGDEVRAIQVGDRVVSEGGHAQYITLREGDLLWKIPEKVSFNDAAFCVLACTVLNGIRLGAPQLGDSAVVIGLGLLGQMACQFLKLFGARPIIGIDIDNYRLKLAAQIGAASYIFNPKLVDVVKEVKNLTEGIGADVVYEVTGLTECYNLAFQLARFKGRVVSLGSPRWPAEVNMMDLHMKALKLVGAIVTSHPSEGNMDNRWTRKANGRLFLELLAEGSINVKDLITHQFSYLEAPKAYQMILEKKENFLAVILKWF